MINLKITIPTYNRPEHIQRQVRDLLPQLKDGVSLIVYDNCSDVPVASCFTPEELERFTLIRNKFNIGGAANIGKCLAENGEDGWIWLLGDDDTIVDNAVDIILDTIARHSECCYINFQQKTTKETEGFLDFLDYLKILGAFGTSFFQSACLFNMDKLKPFVRYYYEFLSSWVGQIVMVIKYLEEHRDEHCYFTMERIVKYCSPGGWSHFDLVVTSSFLVDRFHYLKPIMRGTLFKALGDMNFTSLAQAQAPRREKLYYSRYLKRKLGYWNVLRYNKTTYTQYMLSIILPQKIYSKLRDIAARIYNHSVAKDNRDVN